MKRIVFLLLIFLSACAAPVSTAQPPVTNSPDILYFPETGHSVQPPFSTFFRNRGQLALLGYPITEAMTDAAWTVQYFQFGRLEVHPENPTDYFITIGWLGQLSQRTRPPATPFLQIDARYFPQTGHSVSSVFLHFFDSCGGTVQFGVPISEPFLERGKLVQDFQSVRMIWDADNMVVPVALEPIGENYFLVVGDVSRLQPIPMPDDAVLGARSTLDTLPAGAIIQAVAETTPNPAFVRVIVSITDADWHPVAGYSPRLRSGDETRPFPPTLTTGQTHLLYPVSDGAVFLGTIVSRDGTERLATVRLARP